MLVSNITGSFINSGRVPMVTESVVRVMLNFSAGKKLKVKASSQTELMAAITAAQQFVAL